MHRITITIEDDLLAEIDATAKERGYQNRSETIRDLARAGLQQSAQDANASGQCVAALVYVYDHATEHKQVLILHSVGREFRPWNEYAEQMRAEFDKQSPWPLDVREHALELARSGNFNPEPPFVEYLEALYADRWPDLIVAIGAPAAAFIQRHRDQLFPSAPILFTAIDQRRLRSSGLTENEVVVASTLDFRVLFESF